MDRPDNVVQIGVQRIDGGCAACQGFEQLDNNTKKILCSIEEMPVAEHQTRLEKTIAVEDSQDPRHHVIAGDILSPNTTKRIASSILDFVKPLPNL